MKIYDDLDKLIGSTPMLRLKKTEAAESACASVIAKLEYFNPAGSAKDRVALQMINDAEARGVILMTGQERGLELAEYTPMQVKQAVVGYGAADKRQVISMVTRILNLPEPPKPDDTADALAIAICHAHSGCSRLGGFYNKMQ